MSQNPPHSKQPPTRPPGSGASCTGHGNPRYIVDLVKRIVRVSVESARIVKGLPPLNEAKGA